MVDPGVGHGADGGGQRADVALGTARPVGDDEDFAVEALGVGLVEPVQHQTAAGLQLAPQVLLVVRQPFVQKVLQVFPDEFVGHLNDTRSTSVRVKGSTRHLKGSTRPLKRAHKVS